LLLHKFKDYSIEIKHIGAQSNNLTILVYVINKPYPNQTPTSSLPKKLKSFRYSDLSHKDNSTPNLAIDACLNSDFPDGLK